MLGKLFSKKETPAGDIESLKKKFNQMNPNRTGVEPPIQPQAGQSPQASSPVSQQPFQQPFQQQSQQTVGQMQPGPMSQQPQQYPESQVQDPTGLSVQPPLQPGARPIPSQTGIEQPIPPGSKPVIAKQQFSPQGVPAQAHPQAIAQPAQTTAEIPKTVPDSSPQQTEKEVSPGTQSQSAGVQVESPKPAFEVVEVIEGGGNYESVTLGDAPMIDKPAQKIPDEDAKKIGPTKISRYLDDLKNQLDDTKLTSLIIQQVKELIEIDQNLNNKIQELEDKLKKESKEREKLKELMDRRYEESKKNEKNMDKFIALYEVVTNQFNPFIEQHQSISPQVQGSNKQAEPSIPDLPSKSKAGPIEASDRGEQRIAREIPEAVPKQTAPEVADSIPAAHSQVTGTAAQLNTGALPVSAENVQSQLQSADAPLQSAPGDVPKKPVVSYMDIPAEMHFETKDGQLIKSLPELVALLRGMSSDVFSHHVTKTKNDFAAWVHHVLKNDDLARELGPIKNRMDMIRAIMNHL